MFGFYIYPRDNLQNQTHLGQAEDNEVCRKSGMEPEVVMAIIAYFSGCGLWYAPKVFVDQFP